MRILVVGHERVVAAVIAESLRAQGHDAEVARDVDGAMAADREGASLDAVFLDLDMPGGTGLAALKRLRDWRPTLPVVIFIRKRSARLVAEAERLGVAAVIKKPIVLARLGEALRRALEKE